MDILTITLLCAVALQPGLCDKAHNEAEPPTGSGSMTDQDKLQGAWRIVDVWSGAERLRNGLEGEVIRLREGKTNLLLNADSPEERVIRFSIDPSQSPKHFDLILDRHDPRAPQSGASRETPSRDLQTGSRAFGNLCSESIRPSKA